jgi:PAS domain-containing protein
MTATATATHADADEALLTRLRDLALVDLDALLTGAEGEHYAALLSTHAGDLEDALRQARARMAELLRAVGGADPLALVDATPQVRARDGGREAAERVVQRLAGRASACRALARIDDLTEKLIPRLFEADRRRAGIPGGGAP